MPAPQTGPSERRKESHLVGMATSSGDGLKRAAGTCTQVGFAVFFVVGSAGCEGISGLSAYEEAAGATDGSLSHSSRDASLAEQDSEAARKDGRTRVDSDASDDRAPNDDGADISQESAGSDASEETVTSDADNIADAAPDAPPPCGPMTCSSCCSGGACVSGQSVAACGTGGQDCRDCTNMGGACGSNGSCVTRAADSGPPHTCDPAKCKGCGPYTLACCKSDDTCGCEVDLVIAIGACT